MLKTTIKQQAPFRDEKTSRKLAEVLNETDGMGWTYKVEKKSEKWSKIAVYDETGEFIEYI